MNVLTKARSPLLVGAGAIAVCAGLVLRDPNQPGSWGLCPVLWTTGYYCPGCGMLRATHAALTGDVGRIASYNPLWFVAVPALVALWVLSMRNAFSAEERRVTVPTWAYVAVAVVLTVFGVIRNLPGMEFLRPPV